MQSRRSPRYSPYVVGNEEIRSFLNWDVYLDDVFWPRFRQQQARRGTGPNEVEHLESCRTVATEYYSRHHLLRTDSPPSYVITPSSQGRKGTPVYAYRPGTTMVQSQKFWPSRAHDGSMEQMPASPKQEATLQQENGETQQN